MKNIFHFFAGFFLFLFSISTSAQSIVVKFTGDTLKCDYVSAGGKTLVLKTKGKDNVKVNASEVSYYTDHFKIWMQYEGEKKPHEIDSLHKCFVPADGRIYTVEMENDSVYLASARKEVNGMEFLDYYIFRKKDNTEVVRIKEDKTAIDTMKKYFGGSCSALDAMIKELAPNFQKKVFPGDDWSTLIYTYNTKCNK